MDAALVDLLGRLEDFVQGRGDLGRRDESREKRLGGEFRAVEGCVGIFALDEDCALFDRRRSKGKNGVEGEWEKMEARNERRSQPQPYTIVR